MFFSAIVTLKEELTLFKNSANPPTLEEFIPINKTCDEDPKPETDNGDKKNWLSSTLLWNTNDNNPDTKQNNIPKQNPVQQVIQKVKIENSDDTFWIKSIEYELFTYDFTFQFAYRELMKNKME